MKIEKLETIENKYTSRKIAMPWKIKLKQKKSFIAYVGEFRLI